MRFAITLFVMFLVLPVSASALSFENAPSISEMLSKVEIKGTVETVGSVQKVEFNVSIPQEDEFQKIESLQVSHPYIFVEDRYGNRWIKIEVNMPPDKIDYTVQATVRTYRKTSATTDHKEEFLKPTYLVQSTDPEVVSLAQSVATGNNDFEKISEMVKWTHESITYDLAYGEVNLTAKETLNLRKGVCDEYATVLLSMARSQGYSAAYAVGYAYGRGYTAEASFNAHGWTEIYTDSGGFPADPTWMESGFVDATHIKFLTIPDGIFTLVKASAVGFGDFRVKLSKVSATITPLETEEEPLIRASSSLLANPVWNGFAVVKTDLSANGCYATKVETASCTINSAEFFKAEDSSQPISFCNQKQIFTIFKPSAPVNDAYKYVCPISISTIGGNREKVNVSVQKTDTGSVSLVVDKKTVTPNEELMATAPGAYLFTTDGQYGINSLKMTAPPTNFKVYAYNAGALASEDVSVVKVKTLDLSLAANATVRVGESVTVLLSVTNLLQRPQSIQATFRGNTQSAEVLDRKVFVFNYTSASTEDNFIQVSIQSDGYSTVLSKVINIQEREKGFVEQILDFLVNIVDRIALAISAYFPSK